MASRNCVALVVRCVAPVCVGDCVAIACLSLFVRCPLIVCDCCRIVFKLVVVLRRCLRLVCATVCALALASVSRLFLFEIVVLS